MPERQENWQPVCAAHELTDPGSRGFRFDVQHMPYFGFVVRRGATLRAYENVCPHAGRQLNWGPHRFLTKDQSLIMCAAHGALFDIASGECAAGPCVGERLRSLAVREVGGEVQVNVAGLV